MVNNYVSIIRETTSPLDQFEIRSLLSLEGPSLNISLTNIGLYLTIGSIIILTVSGLATNYNKIISNS
jgi:F-type H+-transporting ATPase subunit a